MTTHVNVNHLGHRNHVCPHESCKRSFGYKHILQRHIAKSHVIASPDGDDDNDNISSGNETETQTSFNIDNMTGNSYSQRAEHHLKVAKCVACPYPNLRGLEVATQTSTGPSSCDFVFSRAYDLRRHLKAVHQVEVLKEVADKWVKMEKKRLS